MVRPAVRTQSGVLDRPDGARIHWRLDGNGDGSAAVVVLLAPEHRTLAVWDEVVPQICSAGARCLRLDWQDQGRSVAGPTPPSFAGFCADARAVLEVVTGTVDVVVGVGVGAMVARHLRCSWPASGLVLVNAFEDFLATDVAGPDEADVVRVVLRGRADGEVAERRGLCRELRVLAGSGDGPDGEAGRAEHVVAAWVQHGQRGVDRHRAVLFEARPPVDEPPQRGVVHVLHGSENRLLPVDHGRRVAERLGTTLRSVPGAGHHIGPTLREATTEAVLELLRRHESEESSN